MCSISLDLLIIFRYCEQAVSWSKIARGEDFIRWQGAERCFLFGCENNVSVSWRHYCKQVVNRCKQVHPVVRVLRCKSQSTMYPRPLHLGLLLLAVSFAISKQPHIVFIVIDDLGKYNSFTSLFTIITYFWSANVAIGMSSGRKLYLNQSINHDCQKYHVF